MNKKIAFISSIALVLLAITVFLAINHYAGAKKNSPSSTAQTASSQGSQQPPQVPSAAQTDNNQLRQATADPAQEPEEAPIIEIPAERQQLIGVKTVVAEIKPLQKIIRTVGLVEYDERRLVTVNTKFEGWIEKLHADYSGKFVRKGEPLADIYSPELLATQQEFINLLKWKQQSKLVKDQDVASMLSKDAQAIIEGAKQRLRLWDISDAQIEKIEQTGKPVRTVTIYSPVSGYVLQKPALKGMRVSPGEKLFDIADLSTVWIVSDIFEYELPLVQVGEKARISLSYFPGKEFTSSIDYVYPTIAGDTRSAKVRFTISNPGNKLKPQMYTNVEVKISLGSKLIVPDDAVLDAGKRQLVYVDKGDGNFEARDVSIGMKADGMVEITKGLKAGERVASSANFLIDSEAKLKDIVK